MLWLYRQLMVLVSSLRCWAREWLGLHLYADGGWATTRRALGVLPRLPAQVTAWPAKTHRSHPPPDWPHHSRLTASVTPKRLTQPKYSSS